MSAEFVASAHSINRREQIGMLLALLGVFVVAYQFVAFTLGCHPLVATAPWFLISGTGPFWDSSLVLPLGLLSFFTPSLLGLLARMHLAQLIQPNDSPRLPFATARAMKRACTILMISPCFLIPLALFVRR